MKWAARVKARVDREAFLNKYPLDDPALRALALTVRGADSAARQFTPASSGLYAVATGLQALAQDDHGNMAKQVAAYDTVYAYCRSRLTRT